MAHQFLVYFFNFSFSNLNKIMLTTATRHCRSDLVYKIPLFPENICSSSEENCLLESLNLFTVMLSLKVWICSVFLVTAYNQPILLWRTLFTVSKVTKRFLIKALSSFWRSARKPIICLHTVTSWKIHP